MPDNITGYLELGELYYRNLDHKQAESVYLRALQQNPNQAQQATTYLALGYIYKETNQPKLAIDNLEKVVDLEYASSITFFNLGLLYETLNQIDKAIFSFQESLVLNPQSAKAYFNLGLLFMKKGNMMSANYHFDQANKLGLTLDKTYIKKLLK